MAQWEFGLASKDNQITAKTDHSSNDYVDFQITQHNVDKILDEVKRDKDLLSMQKKDVGWRKAFTVPDIVAIEIMQKHGIDIHDQYTMSDPALMKKFKYIIHTEYPHLVIST